MVLSPVVELAQDLARRALFLAPIPVVGAYLVAGFDAGLSVLLGIAISVANFMLSAYILTWASKQSTAMIASTSVSGYFIRVSLIAAAVWLLIDVESVSLIWLTLTLVISHLGLLLLELPHVSTTIAHPGLKPKAADRKPAAGYSKELL